MVSAANDRCRWLQLAGSDVTCRLAKNIEREEYCAGEQNKPDPQHVDDPG